MSTFLKIFKWLFIVIVIVVVAFVLLVNLNYPRTFEAPYPDISAVSDSAVIARGAYLVNGAAHCAHCHADASDFQKVEAGERVPMAGGFAFTLPIGNLYPRNITSDPETGIGAYTDQELARVMRYGVKKDGQALMDFMPFYDLSDEDLTAVISYLRTLEPMKKESMDNDFNFIGKALLAFGAIQPMGDGDVPEAPDMDSTALYGEYIANSVANCRGCHTKRDLTTGDWAGEFYAGGFAMDMITENGEISKTNHVISPNITTDPETGKIAGWTQGDFIKRFRKGRLIQGSPMPWGPFSQLSDMELIAIYKYLQTVEPVKNQTPLGVQDGPMPM